jgi:hypothetical protein
MSLATADSVSVMPAQFGCTHGVYFTFRVSSGIACLSVARYLGVRVGGGDGSSSVQRPVL